MIKQLKTSVVAAILAAGVIAGLVPFAASAKIIVYRQPVMFRVIKPPVKVMPIRPIPVYVTPAYVTPAYVTPAYTVSFRTRVVCGRRWSAPGYAYAPGYRATPGYYYNYCTTIRY